ncbi:head-tail connector protein [Pseudomonas abietaniphila]|uniref:head-tail connector protein n=1 Tax=Pseudomonas abietaniphila TaxID=89065 RepID=UPI000781F7A3|nr:head-tail connector protein [Pseudomonas abietaniphila]
MLDLGRVKLHLRVFDNEEDSLIEGYVEAAKAHVAMHCDRVLVDSAPAGPEEMALTPDVEQAILLLVGHWFANREEVVVGAVASQLPMGVSALLWARKRF